MGTPATTSNHWDPCSTSPRMFWEFCAIRMEEWRNRNAGGPPPFTTDPVLKMRGEGSKTIPNVMRELDPETIFMHKHIDPRGPADQLFGSIAFRLTAKIGPHDTFGGPPRVQDLSRWEQHLLKCRQNGIATFIRIYHTPSLAQYIEALQDIADGIDIL